MEDDHGGNPLAREPVGDCWHDRMIELYRISFIFLCVSPLWWMIFILFGGKLYPAHSDSFFLFFPPPLALVLFRSIVDSASGCSCL